MYIHLDRRAVFLCHPRTASRATSEVLKANGFMPVNHFSALQLPFRIAEIDTVHHQRMVSRAPEGWVVACTIRHHYEVITSWLFGWKLGKALLRGQEVYEEQKRKLVTPELFKRLHDKRQMGADIYPHPNILMPHVEFANHICDYERIETDVNKFLERVGIKNKVPMNKVGDKIRGGVAMEDVLSVEMRGLIYARYKNEMQDWGFLPDGTSTRRKPIGSS